MAKKREKTALPDRRLMERHIREVHKIMESKEFDSIEEVNEYMHQLLNETGGTVPLSAPETLQEKAMDLVYQAIQYHGKRRLELAKQALENDENCADAYMLMAEETARTPEQARPWMEKAVRAAENTLGPEFLGSDENVGRYWNLRSRSYMRARAALAEIRWEMGEREDAVAMYLDLLRLDPDDHQGLRYKAITALIILDRVDKAIDVIDEYGDDSSYMAYARALTIYRKEGPTRRAKLALADAIESNRFLPAIVLRYVPMPDQLPVTYAPGTRDEAVILFVDSIEAWMSVRGACEFMAEGFVNMVEDMSVQELPRGPIYKPKPE